MRKLLIILFLFPLLVNAQQSYTLSGKITDAETGEDLIGVSVIAPYLLKGVATNSYGFYSFSLPEGEYLIRFSYLGYTDIEQNISFTKNQVLNIELTPSITELNEVVVSAERDDKRIISPEMGVEKLNLKTIDSST